MFYFIKKVHEYRDVHYQVKMITKKSRHFFGCNESPSEPVVNS